MFIKGNLREDTRTPFVSPVKYSVSVLDLHELKQVNNIAVSVDISTGGLGILTDFPLEQGHVLTFNDEIKINNITSKKAAVVKWKGRINGTYRVGLKFV